MALNLAPLAVLPRRDNERLGVPKGRRIKAQGSRPGDKYSGKGDLKGRSNPPTASGLSVIWTPDPGLSPWALLLDPCGVLVQVTFLTVTDFITCTDMLRIQSVHVVFLAEESNMPARIQRKNYRIDVRKLARTKTETIHRALELVADEAALAKALRDLVVKGEDGIVDLNAKS